MARVANFNASPAVMPLVVLERMQAEMLDYQGRGLSVLEMSHRSAEFGDIAAAAEADFRQLLNIPKDYSVLFMQGGASAQFSLCVQNLDIHRQVANANTGHWSRKAMESARTLTTVDEVVHCLIDQHDLYINRVHPQNRSRMNIPCQLTHEALTSEFLQGASTLGFVGLKGHKSVGGLRASLYNAVTDQAVDALVEYLVTFAEKHA